MCLMTERIGLAGVNECRLARILPLKLASNNTTATLLREQHAMNPQVDHGQCATPSEALVDCQ